MCALRMLTPLPAAFIRGLLENVGAEIDPIRLIRRIKNGLEIPGLKPALIKILSDFNLQVSLCRRRRRLWPSHTIHTTQISLLEGSAAILYHDGRNLSHDLHVCQTQAHYCDGKCRPARSQARAHSSRHLEQIGPSARHAASRCSSSISMRSALPTTGRRQVSSSSAGMPSILPALCPPQTCREWRTSRRAQGLRCCRRFRSAPRRRTQRQAPWLPTASPAQLVGQTRPQRR